MAHIFRIPGSQYRTQEEENFKGVPRSGEQTYFLPDFIGDVGKGFKEMVSEESTTAVQNYNVSQNLNLPTSADINSMGEQELLQLKNKIEFQKKHSVSNQFGNSLDMTLQQINEALNNLALDNNIVPVSYNGIEQGSTDDSVDTSAVNNNTNVPTENEDVKLMNHEEIQTQQDEDQLHNDNVWKATSNAVDAITAEAIKNPELAVALENQVENGEPNQLEENSVLAEDENIVSSNSSQDVFDKGQGELELEESASTTEVTEEGTKTAVEKIKEELLKVMPEQEIPKELLLMKFGANLLRARSNRRGQLPKFLDELGQAIEPVTDTLIAFDMKRQEQDRALALQAYGIYEAQQERAAKDYEYEDLFNVYASDYGPNGVLRGGTTFMGQITTPAEIKYYSSMMYPSEESVKAKTHTQDELDKTPENLRGMPIFTITKTTGAKEDHGSPMGDGIFSTNKTAYAETVNGMQFLETHIRTDAQMLQFVALGMIEGNQPQTGYGAALGKFTQVNAEKLNSLAKFFGVSEGVPILNKLSGEDEYDAYYEAMAAAGYDFTPDGIHASITQDIQYMKDYNDAMYATTGPNALSSDEWALNKSYIATLETAANELKGREGLNLMESLMQKSAFGRARYLQGSNRLLRDVIREAMDIMNVYKSGDRQMMAKLNDNITKYVADYNKKLSFIYDPATEMDKIQKNMLVVDENYNISGGYLNWMNVDQGNPKLGDTINLQDPNVSQDIGGNVEFKSLSDMYESFGMEMPNELKD